MVVGVLVLSTPLVQVRSIVLINCGGVAKLKALTELPERAIVYIVDVHRPTHHTNIREPNNVRLERHCSCGRVQQSVTRGCISLHLSPALCCSHTPRVAILATTPHLLSRSRCWITWI